MILGFCMTIWEEGIASIYTFIRRTAEERNTGLCWETFDYYNNPSRNYNLVDGVGGIPFFLCDYFRYSGDQEAIDMADKALAWCQSSDSNESGLNYQRGLHTGKVGIAYSRLRYDLLVEHELDSYCHQMADHLLEEPCGPITDFMGGEASNGFYLLKLYQTCGDTRYLEGAKRCADWISSVLIRENGGVYCQMKPDEEKQKGKYFLGVPHGMSGVAYYFSLLFAETADEQYRRIANDLFDTIVRYGIESKGGLNWPVMTFSRELPRCQYSHGAVGIGMALVRSSDLLQREDLLAIALRAGEATYGYGDFRQNLTVCTGVSGSGQLMLDLFVETKDELWLDRAKEFAAMAATYKETTSEGDAWPTDEPGLHSAGYIYGASGAGHFFLRITNPEEYEMLLF